MLSRYAALAHGKAFWLNRKGFLLNRRPFLFGERPFLLSRCPVLAHEEAFLLNKKAFWSSKKGLRFNKKGLSLNRKALRRTRDLPGERKGSPVEQEESLVERERSSVEPGRVVISGVGRFAATCRAIRPRFFVLVVRDLGAAASLPPSLPANGAVPQGSSADRGEDGDGELPRNPRRSPPCRSPDSWARMARSWLAHGSPSERPRRASTSSMSLARPAARFMAMRSSRATTVA